MTLSNLYILLEAAASKETSGNIIIYPPGSPSNPRIYSYRDLREVAQRASWALRRREGFIEGSAVLLYFSNHWDIIVWFWGALLAGCVPAICTTLSNDLSQRKAHLEHLSATLEQPICLSSQELLPEFTGQDCITPIAVETLGYETISLNECAIPPIHAALPDDAVLLFTSGSSGRPKAVCLSHGQIFNAISGKFSVVSLPEQTSFLNWVRMDHVAAIIEIHLQAMYAFRDQIHVSAQDVLPSPLAFIDLLETHRVSRTFAPNFFLAKMRDALQQNELLPSPRVWDLTHLKYVASGGEANVTKTVEQLSRLLTRFGARDGVIVPGFGMTETCAGAIFNTSCPEYDKKRKAEFTAVGSCMPGIQMRITDGSSTTALPAGEVGSLEVCGAVVFKRYFNNPFATKEAFTSDGWFKTGDVGSIDENGYLSLVGRAKDTMVINGVNYSPHEVESSIEERQVEGVAPGFTCCFSSFPSGGETEAVYVVYLPTYSPEDVPARAATADAISKIVWMATGSRPFVLPLEKALLPKSALGKLPRTKIKAAYERGEYKLYEDANNEMIQRYRETTRAGPANAIEEGLLATFVRSLDISPEDLDVTTSVFDVGIDSVRLIKLKTDVEEHLGLEKASIPIITLMDNPTVRGLAKALDGSLKEYDPVVTLQTHGTKNPLWLVHPGAGEVLVFINLAKLIVDRPVYALRARGFDEGQSPFESIEEAVDSYYTVIKTRQPKGPYALAGYCYGTMLAFEVSKRLESSGEEVRLLGSFNLPPHIKTRMRMLDWKECLLHLAYFLDLMTQPRSRELAVELTGKSREEILSTIIENSNPDRYKELALSRPVLIRWADVAYELHRMAGDYDPLGSIASMDVFFSIPLTIAAASKEEWRSDHLAKWDDFTRSPTRFHDVPGEHYSMIGPEHVFSFGKTLRKALDDRGM